MKKFFRIFFLLVFFSSLSSSISLAQSMGPKVGINLANLIGDEFEEEISPSYRAGIQWGVAADFPINDRVSIQPELLFVQKGFKVEEEVLGETVKLEAILNYFEIPILAKINLSNGPLQVFVHIGPSISYGMDGVTKESFLGMEQEEDLDFGDDEVNRIDFNGVLGAGLQYPAGPGNLYFDMRYVQDFNDLNSDDADDPESIKSRNFGFSIGYMYSFQKDDSSSDIKE